MPKWLEDAVFYEIYPQSFYDTNGDGIGDINGITGKLDYIKSIGCNAIWINPCFDSPFMDAGYDVRDYKKVAPRYGTNEDLVRCFREAHERGMHILLDLVPGHTSYQHPWFKKSGQASKNEYTDRYIWTDSVWRKPKNMSCLCGVTERDGCAVLNFFSSQPALNYGFNKITEPWQTPFTDPRCRSTFDAILDVMRFWLDLGADGFRVDMADSLVKNDKDKEATCALWRSCREMLDRDYPEAAMVSEWSNPEQALSKAGFHMDFYLDWVKNGYHALLRKTDRNGRSVSFFGSRGKGDIRAFLDEYLKKYEDTKDDGYISLITCNHDTPRMTKSLSREECRLAVCFLMTMPGVPFLYYGDEIGMNYRDLVSKEGGYQRTGSRTPMQWNAGKNMGFSAADKKKLYLPTDPSPDAPNVENEEKDQDSILNSLKRILALRHENRELQADGDFEVLYAEKNKYPFAYRRGKFIFAVNPSSKPVEELRGIPFSGEAPEGEAESVFKIGEAALNGGTLSMGGESFAVFTMNSR